MIEVGDLVIHKSMIGLGLVINKGLKSEHLWVNWITGKYRTKNTLTWSGLLHKYEGGKHGAHLLDWS